MVISRLHRPLSLTLATLGLISLVACGGGGGGSNPPPVVVDDTTPNAFSFTAAEGAEPNAVITSPAATISGINTATPISISGGEYSIAGGAFTSTAGTISNGQTLTVRVTASDKTNTPKEATISVGGVSAKFVVTTLADTTPDAFAFTAQTDVAVNSEHTSEVVTINGIDIAVPVSITGGLYSINGAEFTSATGTVSAGQTIRVKAIASASTESTHNVVVTIGGVSGTYAITTVADTIAPVAEFTFPTPYTLSGANSVKVRGTATDDHAITSVKIIVNGTTEVQATPKAPGDFSSWTAAAPITASAENEIKVVATDDRNNSIAVDVANKVVIRQADVKSAFPDETNQFYISAGMVIDRYEGRDRLLVAELRSRAVIYSVSIATGKREVYKDYRGPGSSILTGMIIDGSDDAPVFYANEYRNKKILKINLASGEILKSYSSPISTEHWALVLDERNGEKSLLSVNQGEFERDSNLIALNLQTEQFSIISSDADQTFMPSTRGLALDKARDRYLVTVSDRNTNLYGIYSIDRKTGERIPFSTNEVGTGEPFVYDTQLSDLAIDEEKETLYAADSINGQLFAIDLNTGNRRIVTNLTIEAYGEIIGTGSVNLQILATEQIAFIGNMERSAISIVDLTTGEKVVLSKSESDY